MSTEQAGAVVVQVTAADFGRLCENSGPWGPLNEPTARFGSIEDGGPASGRAWRRIYWLGDNFAAVIFARAFLNARGHEHEVLFDTASDEGSNRMYGYVILTDYEDERR
jgi:hypothetical protein